MERNRSKLNFRLIGRLQSIVRRPTVLQWKISRRSRGEVCGGENLLTNLKKKHSEITSNKEESFQNVDKDFFEQGRRGLRACFVWRVETRSHAADSTGKTGGVRVHNLLKSHTSATTVDAMAAATDFQTHRELTS